MREAWEWVYEAEDITLHRFVSLKFLPDDVAKDPQALARFQREVQAASFRIEWDVNVKNSLLYEG